MHSKTTYRSIFYAFTAKRGHLRGGPHSPFLHMRVRFEHSSTSTCGHRHVPFCAYFFPHSLLSCYLYCSAPSMHSHPKDMVHTCCECNVMYPPPGNGVAAASHTQSKLYECVKTNVPATKHAFGVDNPFEMMDRFEVRGCPYAFLFPRIKSHLVPPCAPPIFQLCQGVLLTI